MWETLTITLFFFIFIYSWGLGCINMRPFTVVHRLFSCSTSAPELSDFSNCSMWALLLEGNSVALWDLSSWTRDGTHISCISRLIPNQWTNREVLTVS